MILFALIMQGISPEHLVNRMGIFFAFLRIYTQVWRSFSTHNVKGQRQIEKISHLTALYFSIGQESIDLLCFCTFQGAKTPVWSCIVLFALAEVGVYIFKRFREMDSLNKQSNLTWPHSNNPWIHAI